MNATAEIKTKPPFTASQWVQSFFYLLLLYALTSFQNLHAQVTVTTCNTPFTGKNCIVNNIPGNLINLGSGNSDMSNLLDGNLNNFVQFSTTTVLSNTSLVAVKNIKNSYAGGLRTGFVVEPVGGPLRVSSLNGFIIHTYLNNVLQETATSVSASPVTLTLMGASNGKQRISFVTALPFDEIELVQTSALSVLTSLKVYYGFVEPASSCDYDCTTPLTTSLSPAPSINNTATGISGICAFCGVDNSANAVTPSTSDFAHMHMGLGLISTATLAVNAGATMPAGSDAGFVFMPGGGGLLDVSLLGNTTISTYQGGAFQESKTFGNIADIVLLAGNQQALGFKTTKTFDQIRIAVTGVAGLAVDINVYYAFVKKDSDNDGFVDCVDKSAGNDDGMDSDGDGIPDAIDTDCTLDAGIDIELCANQTSYDFSSLNLGTGLTWSVLPTSPTGATVSTTGLVSGMTKTGVYSIEVSRGATCKDTVMIIHREALTNPACNNPITGPSVKIFDPSNGGCLLCIGSGPINPANMIDGDLSNYVETTTLSSVLASTPIIGVQDTLLTYPIGTRTGFVIRATGGLLTAGVLSNLEIRTYNNGVFQESVATNNPLVSVELLAEAGNKHRISFVTTKAFDAVVLVANSAISVSLLGSLCVYYAFEEPSGSCSVSSESCSDLILANSSFHARIVPVRTGFSGVACVSCSINDIGNTIDDNPDNYATINQGLGLASEASISIKSGQAIGTRYRVGFIISGNTNLLDLSC